MHDRVPNLIITIPKDADMDKTHTDIKKIIQTKCKVPINKIIKNNTNLLVSCATKDDLPRVGSILKDNLDEKMEIKVDKLKNPTIKVIEITTEMDQEELEMDINSRNFSGLDEECKVLYISHSA